MKKVHLILVGFLLFSTAYSTSVENLDKVVAFVNEDVITQSELNQQVALLQTQLRSDRHEKPDQKTLAKHALNQLINVRLQLQLAKKMQIKVTEKQLEASIKRIAKRNHLSMRALKEKLAEERLSFEAYREQLRTQMIIADLQQRLVASQINITPQQLKDFIAVQREAQGKKTQYHVKHLHLALPSAPTTRQIQATRARAQKLLQHLRAGASFDAIINKESSSDDALRQGDLGWRKIEELPEAFIKPVKKLKRQAYSEPIQAGNGFHIVKLVAKRNSQSKHYSTQYHVKQIVLKVDELTNGQEIEQKLKSIRKHVQRGEAFSDFAKSFSQDENSSDRGGDLGWIFIDELPPILAEAIRQASPGSVLQPLQTSLGWHLIQVLDARKVEDSKRLFINRARQLLFQQKLQIAVENWLHRLRQQAYVKVESID